MARRYPRWVTPDRQDHLVKLFVRSRGFCVYGHTDCLIPEHYYEFFIEDLIADWKADDRAQDSADWQAERKRIHSLAERQYPLRGAFSAVSKEIFFADQPQYYVVGIGISGLTFKPFVLLRLASSYICLYVDTGDRLKGLSKSRRRKAIRYGKPLPLEYQKELSSLCRLAVKHYLEH
ncbi:hypothetical protein ES707_05546 [subsurface metagenome]